MNVNPALLLVSGLLPFLAQGVSTCQQTKPAAVAGTPSPTPVPVLDLSGYTPEDLAAYANYCDVQVKAALSRGDTSAAQAWANTRTVVQAKMKSHSGQNRYPSKPRYRATPTTTPAPTPTPEEPRRRPGYLLPPNWPIE
jgi:hypothetical protein